MHGQFNHYMMTLARESRGLTQAELASKADIAQGTLSKYENGISDPLQEFAERISAVLDFPMPFFYESGRPFGFPPFHFRKRKKLSAKVLGRIVAQMNIRRMHIQTMASAFDLRSVCSRLPVPEIDVDDYAPGTRKPTESDEVARSLRETWMLPSGPVENMMDLVETSGGVVVHCDFGSDQIDAMSQRIDGLPVLFFVNTSAPSDRVRFTLAHELGHMVLHTSSLHDDSKMENEADNFAGEFLLPRSQVKPQLRKFDLPTLANMKRYWKVSMAAIAVRAERLGAITPYQSKMFWIDMGKLGYRKSEPFEPPREEPTLVRRMVAFHKEKLGYSDAEMCAILKINKKDYEEMYGGSSLPAPSSEYRHLRVVK